MIGWEPKKIGDVLKLEYGKPLPKEKRDEAGTYIAYGANGIKCRTNEHYWDKPSIIVGRKGSAGELNLTEEKFWPLDVTYFVTFDEQKYDLKFLYFCLQCLDLTSLAKGVKPGINRNDVYGLKAVFPPLPEQKRIVAILDEAFAGIDAAVANTEKNLANARELFESYLNAVFTQKGDGWVEKTLQEVLTVQPRNGWSPPAKNHSESGTPVLTLSSVTGFHFDGNKRKFTNAPVKKDAHYWLNDGEFLITRSNTPELVGHVAICAGLTVPTICCDLIMKMQVDAKVASAKFLYWYFRTPKLRKFITGSAQGANPTMKKINKGIVQNLPVTFPVLLEQKNIAKKIDELYLETQRLESIYQQKLEFLAELKQSILQKAFAGELTALTDKAVEEAVA